MSALEQTGQTTVSQRLIPFSTIYTGQIDIGAVGVYVLYHVKKSANIEDAVPVCFGYGHIVQELKKMEERLKFIPPEPLYYEYVDHPEHPDVILQKLREILKTALS
jgi:hypothetical protein